MKESGIKKKKLVQPAFFKFLHVPPQYLTWLWASIKHWTEAKHMTYIDYTV